MTTRQCLGLERTAGRALRCFLAAGVFVAITITILPSLGTPAILAAEKDESKCRRGEKKTEEGCVRDPRIVRKIDPTYPPEARRKRVEGSVTLIAVINRDGYIEDVKVANAQATDVDFIPAFQEAAIKAIESWRFKPGTLDGEPRAVDFTAVMDFMLK